MAENSEGRAVGASRGQGQSGNRGDVSRGCVVGLVEEIGDVDACGHLRAADLEFIGTVKIDGGVTRNPRKQLSDTQARLIFGSLGTIVVRRAADLQSLQRAFLEFVSRREVEQISRGFLLERAESVRGVARIALVDTNVLVGIGEDHAPARQNRALHIEFGSFAAHLAGHGVAASGSAASALMGRVSVGFGNVRLGQVIICGGGPQLPVKKLEFDAGFGVPRARRGDWRSRIDEAAVGAEALRVVNVSAHPFFRPPQQAEARRNGL